MKNYEHEGGWVHGTCRSDRSPQSPVHAHGVGAPPAEAAPRCHRSIAGIARPATPLPPRTAAEGAAQRGAVAAGRGPPIVRGRGRAVPGGSALRRLIGGPRAPVR